MISQVTNDTISVVMDCVMCDGLTSDVFSLRWLLSGFVFISASGGNRINPMEEDQSVLADFSTIATTVTNTNREHYLLNVFTIHWSWLSSCSLASHTNQTNPGSRN